MFIIYDDFKKVYENKTVTGAAAFLRIPKQTLSRGLIRCAGYYIYKKRWRIVDTRSAQGVGAFYLELMRFYLGRPAWTATTARELKKAAIKVSKEII